MLRFEQLGLRRGSRLLLDNASFSLHAGWRVGLTGRNGSGKSSLLALINGELSADAGTFSRPAHWQLAHVRQEAPPSERCAIDHVIDGDQPLRRLQQQIAMAEDAGDGVLLGTLHDELAAIGGHAAQARAATLMHGLGFAPQDGQRTVAEFSGGWRMRLNLAQTLMCRSDLMLLDEPTNHLDLHAVLWLEDWLRQYQGTLIVVSHDREFLDGVVSHVLHLADGTAELFQGSVSNFEQKRAQRMVHEQAAWQRQQEERAHMQRFVDRFRATASKAAQAQSRLKALERMELLAPVRAQSAIHFRFRTPQSLPDPLLVLEAAGAAYGDHVVLESVDLTLRPGDRVGLLGANGAGKSTLIKLLAGQLRLAQGECHMRRGLSIGYFAQHQLEQLQPGHTPVEHVLQIEPTLGESGARDFLGGFGFSNERAVAPAGQFSGGEKARLALALIVLPQPNLLLLDEPTNHLDAETRDALAQALQEFDGAIVLVAHDRGLLRACCDTLLRVADRQVEEFTGDLDDYARWLRDLHVAAPNGNDTAPASRRDERRERAQARQRSAPLRRRIAQIEAELEDQEKERARIDADLAREDLYTADDGTAVAELTRRRGQLEQEITRLEDAWLQASEELSDS